MTELKSTAAPKPSDSVRRVWVVDYDPSWRQIFERLKASIWVAVEGVAESVEHVGSTAVPGLAAKPIIDIDVIVSTPSDLVVVAERLTRIGYAPCGDLGIKEREAFHSPSNLPAHHLYACARGSAALENHLVVRDILRACRTTAEAYGKLKKRLAEQYFDDPRAYATAKTQFCIELLRKADFSEELLRSIQDAN